MQVQFQTEQTHLIQELSLNLDDYEIIREIGKSCLMLGGVEDISFLFLAKHKSTGRLLSLKLTDLTISIDYEFIEQVVVMTRLI
jgi:hypothetical protein